MPHAIYCQLKVTKHAFSAKCDVVIDMGQQNVSTTYADAIKDYTSDIDALNYMAAQGWELVSSYGNQALMEVRHILKKTVNVQV